jgi:hypothetical protein
LGFGLWVVHKTGKKGKVTKVKLKVIFGREERICQGLYKCVSNNINTSYVEHSNGTLRQINTNLRRKSLTFTKEMEYFEAKVGLSIYSYNFIRQHCLLSKILTKHEPPPLEHQPLCRNNRQRMEC